MGWDDVVRNCRVTAAPLRFYFLCQESRLPARERPTESRYDCDLDETGAFDRAGLIKFLEDKAKGDKDWDEYKPYVHETRGQSMCV